jgi:hypothetical protein
MSAISSSPQAIWFFHSSALFPSMVGLVYVRKIVRPTGLLVLSQLSFVLVISWSCVCRQNCQAHRPYASFTAELCARHQSVLCMSAVSSSSHAMWSFHSLSSTSYAGAPRIGATPYANPRVRALGLAEADDIVPANSQVMTVQHVSLHHKFLVAYVLYTLHQMTHMVKPCYMDCSAMASNQPFCRQRPGKNNSMLKGYKASLLLMLRTNFGSLPLTVIFCSHNHERNTIVIAPRSVTTAVELSPCSPMQGATKCQIAPHAGCMSSSNLQIHPKLPKAPK